ncbi:Histidine triad nucleotide-binding protein 3 [Ancistrocladus abbreviatus]
MEAPRRRLAILSSQLRPIASASSHSPTSPAPCSNRSSCFSVSNCSSESDNCGHRSRDCEEEGASLEKDCVFCEIIRGQSPAYKLYEDDQCLCILDINPLSHGHALLIPKFHFSSLDATPPSVIAAMCSKIPFISNAIVKATSCDSFNLLVNNGVAAGQVIFHTHIHIIPRKARDCLWAHESLKRLSLKLDKGASQLAERIREQMSSSNPEEQKRQRSTVGRN